MPVQSTIPAPSLGEAGRRKTPPPVSNRSPGGQGGVGRFEMLPAVEPHVLEGDERVPFCDELQQSFDVICVDVSQNQQFEFPLIPGRAEKRCFSAAWVLWRPPSTRIRRGAAGLPYWVDQQ